jgi:short-subunit dehydrogenase
MKTAWITGSSSGIGKAMAMEFNRHGYFTILSARRTEVLPKFKISCLIQKTVLF